MTILILDQKFFWLSYDYQFLRGPSTYTKLRLYRIWRLYHAQSLLNLAQKKCCEKSPKNSVWGQFKILLLYITTHELHDHNLEMIMRGFQKWRWVHSFLLLLFGATEFSTTKGGRKMIYLTLKAPFDLYLCDFRNKNVISAFFASKNWFE